MHFPQMLTNLIIPGATPSPTGSRLVPGSTNLSPSTTEPGSHVITSQRSGGGTTVINIEDASGEVSNVIACFFLQIFWAAFTRIISIRVLIYVIFLDLVMFEKLSLKNDFHHQLISITYILV